jgi:serine protease AprX
MPHVALNKDPKGNWRFYAQYDATTDQVVAWANKGRKGKMVGVGIVNDDDSGHGTHVQSVILNSATEADGTYHGIAPYAHLVSVKAFDENGQGSYADVIRGINWVVNNSADRKIRVLNLSLNATPKSHYWDDPLNRAVMRAWESGIVVVASAGNTGPNAMSIGVPGNVPYVITVGAMTDNYTPADGSDDRLATFSAAGPTVEGFVKPEIVAPGGHVLGLMNNSTTIATEHPEFHDGGAYFTMSGTSQAASIVTGVAALVLEAEPALTPDMVKCKIMNAARPAVDGNGNLAYSVFQQGAGMVNAYDAVYSWNYGCANRGLDIAADLAGDRHFGGRANQNADGTYYLMGLEGYLWTDEGVGTEGYLWTDGGVGVDGLLWTDGYLWTDGTTNINGYLWTDGGGVQTDGYLWTDGDVGIDGYLWTDGLTETMSINTWVDQQ